MKRFFFILYGTINTSIEPIENIANFIFSIHVNSFLLKFHIRHGSNQNIFHKDSFNITISSLLFNLLLTSSGMSSCMINNRWETPLKFTTKVISFCLLLKCFRSLFDRQRRPRTDCSCSLSTLFASTLTLVNNVRQLFAADKISR